MGIAFTSLLSEDTLAMKEDVNVSENDVLLKYYIAKTQGIAIWPNSHQFGQMEGPFCSVQSARCVLRCFLVCLLMRKGLIVSLNDASIKMLEAKTQGTAIWLSLH